jgi:hypothetical protein
MAQVTCRKSATAKMALTGINNSEIRCMRVSKFGVISGVTLQRRVIGMNIGNLHTNFCNFKKVIQDNTNHSFLIYKFYTREILFELNIT